MERDNYLNNGAMQTNSTEYTEIYCDMAKHILLCLFTFGIWYLIWIYKATRYLNRAPEGEQYDPTNKLLLCLFVPFYSIYWFYRHGQKLDSMMRERRLDSGEMATLCLILGIFIPVVACILMQDKFNKLCMTAVGPANGPAITGVATGTYAWNTSASIGSNPVSTETETIENLTKYKTLLESGVITQEEFDAKKKQLLGF